MIASLRGVATFSDENSIIVDVQGVGYEVMCSQNTLSELQGQADVSLQIYTHVREDIIQLMGFVQPLEKKLFLELIKVNGIGPKMAMAILSASTPQFIINLIDNGDAAGLSKLPKVGKKKAEQIILALKGKLESATMTNANSNLKDIKSALINLGFKANDVDKVVSQFGEDVNVEDGIKKGLTELTTL